MSKLVGRNMTTCCLFGYVQTELCQFQATRAYDKGWTWHHPTKPPCCTCNKLLDCPQGLGFPVDLPHNGHMLTQHIHPTPPDWWPRNPWSATLTYQTKKNGMENRWMVVKWLRGSGLSWALASHPEVLSSILGGWRLKQSQHWPSRIILGLLSIYIIYKYIIYIYIRECMSM